MTVQELYEAALALLSEQVQRAKSYNIFKIPIVNQIIAECFDINNGIRASEGLTPYTLAEMPMMKKEEDVIPYDIRLLRICMPYGVASLLVIDDDKSKASVFSEEYNQRKAKLSFAVPEEVVDVYSEVE
ncbi:MAG: hypothetical protein IJD83_06335 [Clostridia bacterium]|nr:hypothetical protein [Clostridia bacterium]